VGNDVGNDEQDYKNFIGRRLKYLREDRKIGYSRKDVADELQVPPSTYNDWEGGRRGPNGKVLVTLAKYYETTVDFITGYSDDDSSMYTNDIEKMITNMELVLKGKTLTNAQIVRINALLQMVSNNKIFN
jgi:transcriptional regulator with XRE-family HTH domain